MNQEEAGEVAKYIAGALGKTRINDVLCSRRLGYYIKEIELIACNDFIQTARAINQKSHGEAVAYLATILTLYGVDKPDIWWREDNSFTGPLKPSMETKNSIKGEIYSLLKKVSLHAGCAAYNQAKMENEPEDSEQHQQYRHLENQFADKARKFENDIIDLLEFLAR